MEEFTEKKMVDEVIDEWESHNSDTLELLMKMGSGPLKAYVNNFVAYMPVKGSIYRDIVNTPVKTDAIKRKIEIINAVDEIIQEQKLDFADSQDIRLSELCDTKMEEIVKIYVALINRGFTPKELTS